MLDLLAYSVLLRTAIQLNNHLFEIRFFFQTVSSLKMTLQSISFFPDKKQKRNKTYRRDKFSRLERWRHFIISNVSGFYRLGNPGENEKPFAAVCYPAMTSP